MPARSPTATVVVKTVVATLIAEGADLRSISLVEFKNRISETIRRMVERRKTIAA